MWVLQSISRLSSFGVAELCAFCQYRDPCCFSCHLSGFRGFSSISVVSFVRRSHQMFIMQKIQLAELIGFFVCSETCCFSLHSSVLLILQDAENVLRFTRPMYETF